MISVLKGYNIFKTLVLVVIIYSIFFWFFKMETTSRLIKFISDLGVIIAIVGFILTQLNKIERREDEDITDFNEQQERGFIEIETKFLEYYPELFPLYKEMHLENKILQSVPNPPKIDPIKRVQFECNMFNIITQRIENILASSLNFEEFKQSATYNEWVRTWRQWFQSPILRNLWNVNRSYYFAPMTIEFIDRVIIDGGSQKPQTGYPTSPQHTGCPTSLQHTGYPTSPQHTGYPTSPQQTSYITSPQQKSSSKSVRQRPNRSNLSALKGGKRSILSKGRLVHLGFPVPYF